ncbi:hypothetical protein B0H16DRAFT_1890804 [Mycena metata]|uniref:Cell division cycle protein 123 n=1 Tax=Mycena metata TaxID=1033252 RepID=A0AAD7N1K4_9AGAR|nr:hypothetical protein B0H16DRAFT_1890804 [Mycena metata]
MLLNLISSTTVSQSIDDKTELFNTCFVDPLLLPPVLASRIPTVLPDPRTTFYGCWIDLVVRLRNLDPSVVRTVTLTPYYAKTLLDASTVAMLTGKISNLHKDDLLDPSPFDHLFPKPTAAAVAPPRYFVRYDTASPKDSPLDAPLTSPSAVVDQLATSQRSHSSLSEALASEALIRLYFMPWDPMMDTRREYRVFCAPTSEYNPHPNRVTAVSQYKWYKPSLLAELPREQIEAQMDHLLEGIERIHGEIMAYSVKNDTKESIDKEGFVFDVYVHTDIAKVQLLELNPFGIASGCGSCLFNWVTDAETLYGNKDKIEVRLSI